MPVAVPGPALALGSWQPLHIKIHWDMRGEVEQCPFSQGDLRWSGEVVVPL